MPTDVGGTVHFCLGCNDTVDSHYVPNQWNSRSLTLRGE